MALLLRAKTFLRRITLDASSVRNHFIVLLPEVEEETLDRNFLSKKPNGLFDFDQFENDIFMSAIWNQTVEYETGIGNIERNLAQKSADVVKDLLEPLELLGSTLDSTWGMAKCMYIGNSVLMPAMNYQSIHERVQNAKASKFTSITIYNVVKNSLEQPNLGEEHVRILKKFQLEGKLYGLQLSNLQRGELQQCLKNLYTEKKKFKDKVEKVTNEYKLLIPKQVVDDFPEKMKLLMGSNEPNRSRSLTLQPNLYAAFMEHCSQRDLRFDAWKGVVSRCCTSKLISDSTSINIERIRSLRKTQANLLGYKTFADISMETKMAGSVENVKTTLHLLAEECKVSMERDLEELNKFAKQNGCKDKLELWDIAYWRKRALEKKFKFNEDSYRNYFPFSKVLARLFSFCEKIFGVRIKARSEVSAWDESVTFYDVFEGDSTTNPLAGFYLDPYARTRNKFWNVDGWAVRLQNRSDIIGTKPLVSLFFNFPSPTEERPSLLSFKELSVMFNKFGYCLQHILSKASYSEVSGTSNMEWDAVEVCGNVFAQFLYNRDVLKSISCHYESNEELPIEMFNTLCLVKNHMAAYELSEEIYLSMLDLHLHSAKDYWLDVVKDLWPKYRILPLHKQDSHPCSFSKIFDEEWAASYYCHLWARLVAADVYAAFEEVENNTAKLEQVGKRFRRKYLALSGNCHPREVFRQFRGRDPSPAAFLKSINEDLRNAYVESSIHI